MRKELVALETQKQAILGNHAGRSMNRLPIYEMASSKKSRIGAIRSLGSASMLQLLLEPGLWECGLTHLSLRSQDQGGSALRRRLTAMLAMVVMTVMLGAVPALADPGGEVHAGSCGLGTGGAFGGISDPTAPGASENARFPPSEAGCTGQG